jgi:hypothetical protein
LLSLAGDNTGEDLLYASSHLNVLSLCSYGSGTAKMLYRTLQIMFNEIREVVLSPAYHAMCQLQLVVKDPEYLPASYYDAVDGAKEISKTILDLSRRVVSVLEERLSF